MDIHLDKNGTKYYYSENKEEIIFLCQFCQRHFRTKRLFNQKYCCSSCRVNASQHRNNGLGGTKDKKRGISNKEVIQFIRNSSTSNFRSLEQFVIEELEISNKELLSRIKDLEKDLNGSIQNARNTMVERQISTRDSVLDSQERILDSNKIANYSSVALLVIRVIEFFSTNNDDKTPNQKESLSGSEITKERQELLRALKPIIDENKDLKKELMKIKNLKKWIENL